MLPLSCSQILSMNWCGVTKIRAVAPLTADLRSGFAMTFEGSVMPGRYLYEEACEKTATTRPDRTEMPASNALDVLMLLVDDFRQIAPFHL